MLFSVQTTLNNGSVLFMITAMRTSNLSVYENLLLLNMSEGVKNLEFQI
jgi:hypothetical protein